MGQVLEIVHPDGNVVRRALGERVIVGRQPKDGIAIPGAAELEPEHLLLVPRKEGCWLSVVEGARTPATIAGRRLDGGVVPWGTDVEIGSVRVTIGAAPSASPVAGKTSPVALLGGAALLAAIGWLFLSDGSDDLPAMSTSKPPALFEARASCPQREPDAAAASAREAADAARAKSERYAFAAQDGVQAALRYAVAASCFTVAGLTAEASSAAAERDALQARIVKDYRTHQLRLERAIEYGRTRQALVETRELLGLVAHLDHPYRTWLRSAERRLVGKMRAR